MTNQPRWYMVLLYMAILAVMGFGVWLVVVGVR
jgi:hypothetical protein